MTSSQPSPFLFGELKGTSWHKRFVAGEFRIFLDHYPEKQILLDKVLGQQEYSSILKMQEYHNEIISFFTKNELIDSMMPIEILNHLRKVREKIFGIHVTAWLTKSDKGQLINSYTADESRKTILRKKLENVKKIIYFPEELCSPESDLLFLSGITEAEIELHLQNESLPLREEGLNNLQKKQSEGTFILTTNIWMYLEIFRRLKNFGFVLNNSEWFSHGLFQKSNTLSTDSRNDFNNSRYGSLLTATRPQEPSILTGVQPIPFPANIDCSGVEYCSLSLASFLDGNQPINITESFRNRINSLHVQGFNLPVETGFYRFNNNLLTKTSGPEIDSVIISTASINEGDAEAEPIFLDGLSSPERLKPKGCGFLSSFNYYFTENLLELYNNRSTENQKITQSGFFIDYIGMRKNKEWKETLPLYNKAFLGCTLSGRFFTGYYPVSSIRLSSKDESLFFEEHLINPPGDGSGEGIYLPSSDCGFAGGKGYSIVLIQDKIILRGKGPFRIPPMGAVAVMEKDYFKKSVSVNIETNLKGLPEPTDRLKWLVGGFNLLINNGTNLVKDINQSRLNMEKEGWYSEASAMTQETQLYPGVKQPRIVFGRTNSGKLILASFSGRTNLSAGASFEDCALFMKNHISEDDKIEFLINFDGGASASLTAFSDGICTNLSLTAPSETNPAGIQRPVPAYFMIRKRSTTGDK